ncbi:MAG: hypothetical protein ACRD2Y_04775 [Terriglobales bacterium]
MRMKATTRNRIALAFARYRDLRASDVEAMVRAIEKPQRPVVIDLPFSALERSGPDAGAVVLLEDAKRCVEIKADGRRCEEVRDEGSERCVRHTEWFKTPAAVMGLRCPEDAAGLHEFLVRTLALVAQGTFPPQKAGAITRLCGLIEKNMRQYRWQMEEARWARRQEGGRRREEAGRTLTTEGTEESLTTKDTKGHEGDQEVSFNAENAEIAKQCRDSSEWQPFWGMPG